MLATQNFDSCVYSATFKQEPAYVRPILKTANNNLTKSNNFGNKLDSQYLRKSAKLKFEIDNRKRVNNIKIIQSRIQETQDSESSELSVYDPIESVAFDRNDFEVCPGHSLVEIKDCMNINAVEKDESLYIFEKYTISGGLKTAYIITGLIISV